LVKDEKGDLLADFHNILNRWSNCFCQLLNVHGIDNFRQTETHTAESSFSLGWNGYWKVGELIQAREKKHYILRSTNLLILFVLRKNCH